MSSTVQLSKVSNNNFSSLVPPVQTSSPTFSQLSIQVCRLCLESLNGLQRAKEQMAQASPSWTSMKEQFNKQYQSNDPKLSVD